jgi:hypothetical protein
MTAPSFISSTATVFNSVNSPKTTGSIAVTNGDVLVAHAMAENGTAALTIATATGSTSAWTLKVDSAVTGTSNPFRRSWTATATATGNITVSATGSGTVFVGLIVKVWRGSSGIGAVNRGSNATGSGSPSVVVTTTGANSGIDFANCDWNGATGTTTFTATSGTPVSDLSDQTSSAHYCVYSFHVVDASAAGAKTMAMSSPGSQRYDCSAIEILGTGGGPAFIAGKYITLQAIKRASYW